MNDVLSAVLFTAAGGSGHRRRRGGRSMNDTPSAAPFATAERAAMAGEAAGP